jgi:DNA-binding CsgD family transcriptional regulator
MVLSLHKLQNVLSINWLWPNTVTTGRADIYLKKNVMIKHVKTVIQDKELNGIEKEILYSMQKGLSSNEIASLFNCSKEMINKHRQSILQKTNCSSMFDVISLGAKKGWI